MSVKEQLETIEEALQALDQLEPNPDVNFILERLVALHDNIRIDAQADMADYINDMLLDR